MGVRIIIKLLSNPLVIQIVYSKTKDKLFYSANLDTIVTTLIKLLGSSNIHDRYGSESRKISNNYKM
jgi:hypothetical protein